MSNLSPIKNISLFQGLDDEDIEQLERSLVKRKFRAGQMIFHMGDEGGNLYIINKGKAKVTIPSESGDDLILDILTPGEIMGEISLIDGMPRSASVQAIEDTEVLCLYREDFLNLLKSRFNIVLHILKVLAQRLRNTDMMLAESHFLNITGRLAKKLMDLAHSFGIEEEKTIRLSVRVTQRDLASMIGATRESVNKTMKIFKEEGIIGWHKGYIRIIDKEKLISYAGPI